VRLGLEGRVAVVGGSSSGLGYAAAERLALEGAAVMVVSRSQQRVERAVARIRESGGRSVDGIAVDLTEPEAPGRVVEAARETFGPPTVVVANAGGPPSMPAVDAAADDLSAACELLLLPVQRLLHAALPAMRVAGWGRFVAITSVAVRQPQPGLVLSNSLRAAVTGYLKSVSDEVAADGINVNTVCPGYTATERLDELAAAVAAREGGTIDEILAGWAGHAPVRRLLEPREVASAVAFLCSDEASGITGIALPVDGGFSRALL
jgi:3-oxoacyl-[acyl-carrier protein] reductase